MIPSSTFYCRVDNVKFSFVRIQLIFNIISWIKTCINVNRLTLFLLFQWFTMESQYILL